jgi:hypothetical protein
MFRVSLEVAVTQDGLVVILCKDAILPSSTTCLTLAGLVRRQVILYSNCSRIYYSGDW